MKITPEIQSIIDEYYSAFGSTRRKELTTKLVAAILSHIPEPSDETTYCKISQEAPKAELPPIGSVVKFSGFPRLITANKGIILSELRPITGAWERGATSGSNILHDSLSSYLSNNPKSEAYLRELFRLMDEEKREMNIEPAAFSDEDPVIYRTLNPGEIIREGDECFLDDEWCKDKHGVGYPMSIWPMYRRTLSAAIIAAVLAEEKRGEAEELRRVNAQIEREEND